MGIELKDLRNKKERFFFLNEELKNGIRFKVFGRFKQKPDVKLYLWLLKVKPRFEISRIFIVKWDRGMAKCNP